MQQNAWKYKVHSMIAYLACLNIFPCEFVTRQKKKRFLALLQDNKENVTEVITLHPQRKKLKCLIKSFQLILN